MSSNRTRGKSVHRGKNEVRWIAFFGLLLTSIDTPAVAQDSVDVAFRFTAPPGTASVSLVGEFNSWVPGAWPMGNIGGNTFARTARLRIGGHPGGYTAGAYHYKFYTGAAIWPNDPLNFRSDPSRNDNSFLYINDPTIYQLVPNQRTGVVRTGYPEISAYLFPKVGSSIDTSTLSLRIGSRTYSGLGSSYDLTAKQLRFRVPDKLSNGQHTVYLTAGPTTDSVSITVQAGFVQVTNVGNFTTRNPQRTLYGVIEDTTIQNVRIIRNDEDTIQVNASAGKFTATAQLLEGMNTFRAIVWDSLGTLQASDSVSFTYFVNHAPSADISFVDAGGNVVLSAQGSTDPDAGQTDLLQFVWYEDAVNPQQLPGVAGSNAKQVSAARPVAHGEYSFTLIATDPDGNKDTTRSFFTILENGDFQSSSLATVPRWVKQGRVYEMFFKSMTPQGTINAAIPYLPYLKSLGVSILWVMPIMENASPINNRTGTGYNIVDFFKVAPEYGTNQDFRNFVDRAHQLGLKVILDVTPNHTSYRHPFVLHARQFRENSPYWTFYQHSIIPHNTNNLGQSMTADGFVYYSGFSDQLLNYNWSDIDARTYMIEVYKWWIREFDIDGYRFDVYWGPHRRAGNGSGNELEMGFPVRKALKNIKPSILLLAEDDGTGVGTEVIYADRSGGVDAGYDWSLYGGAIKPFSFDANGIENLHSRYYNSNFYPGPNSSFLRFMENHDEERAVTLPTYGSYARTMPVATTVFTVPGLPMIYSGQEVGFGVGLSDFYQRTRGVIDWNAPGKSTLLAHYQRLAHARARFPAFSSQLFVRLASGNSLVYAYTRPYDGEDGIVAVNFGSSTADVSLPLSSGSLASSLRDGKPYYANDLYNDTAYAVSFWGGSGSLAIRLKPYGSVVFVLSDSIKRLDLPGLEPIPVSVQPPPWAHIEPASFRLHQNYPNPFNPVTTISYEIATAGPATLRIYDILGKEVSTLVKEWREPGFHAVRWNGLGLDGWSAPSGIYFARLVAGSFSDVKKLILLR